MAHEARYDFKFSLANASQIDRNAPEARYNGHRKRGPTAKSSEPFLDLKSGQKRCFFEGNHWPEKCTANVVIWPLKNGLNCLEIFKRKTVRFWSAKSGCGSKISPDAVRLPWTRVSTFDFSRMEQRIRSICPPRASSCAFFLLVGWCAPFCSFLYGGEFCFRKQGEWGAFEGGLKGGLKEGFKKGGLKGSFKGGLQVEI